MPRKSEKPGDASMARLDDFLQFAKEARANASATPKSVRVSTPIVRVDDQINNWIEGYRAEYRVLKTLKALLRQADVPELVPTGELLEEILKANPGLVDLQNQAQEACAQVVIKMVSPYSKVSVTKADATADAKLKLLDEMLAAIDSGDKATVKAIQKELANL
jgi:hypothetical protein